MDCQLDGKVSIYFVCRPQHIIQLYSTDNAW